MPARKSKVLTEVELEFMEIVWEQGEVTARSMVDILYPRRKPAESSIRWMLQNLENKGYLEHRLEGRTYVYRPVVAREEATRKMIQHLADRISGGSTDVLVTRIMELEKISEEELEEIKRRIEEKEQEGER